jgi:CheY-like chemotaxis protein
LLYSELSKIERSAVVDVPHCQASLDLDSLLVRSSLRGLNILVVDNNELNRASALFQFSEGNQLSVCETYKEAVDLLRSRTFDVALLDLLMPPESFTLSDTAFEKVIGSEFPAGIFIALVAARAGVKNIRIITDASHHDHPATALIDYISWGTEIPCGNASRITFEKARTVQIPRSTDKVNDSVKDWASILEDRSLLGSERTAQPQSE